VTNPHPIRIPKAGPRPPSLTRSASNRRTRYVQEAKKGNVNGLRHGAFATVQAWPDVSTETMLIFATRPALDPLRDRRLVELLATSNVQRQRTLLAIEAEGMTSTLTSYESRLAALVERLERAVHERERERIQEHKAATAVPLDQYRPRAVQEPGA
jgi:hypothetical protein